MATININGHTVLAHSQQEGGHHYTPEAASSSYILVQCSDFPSNEELQQLEDMKIRILEKLENHTYLCCYEPADLDIIRALPFVTYANVYHPDLVVHKSLTDGPARLNRRVLHQVAAHGGPTAVSSATPTEPVPTHENTISVNVMLHPGAAMTPADLKARLSNELNIDPAEINEDVGSVMLDIQADHLDQIARIDDVRRIRELPRFKLHNYTGRTTLGFGIAAAGKRLEARQRTFDGEGEVVAVADSGFDRGIIDDHNDTRMHVAFVGRMVKLANYNYKAVGDRASADPAFDTHGHGTHVCGSVAGCFTSTDPNHTDTVKGTAPKARLFVHACDFKTFTKDWVYSKLLNDPYDAVDVQARIFTNSWGEEPHRDPVPGQYGYNDPAEKTDGIVNTKRDLIALWAAGNSGTAANANIRQLGGIASAKNILTVGACFSSHPQDDSKYKFVFGDPNGDPNAITDFSSFGPTKEGRMKPDVLAPGTCIYSARTRGPMSAPANWVPDWDNPKDEDPLDPTKGKGEIFGYGDTTDPNGIFCTGTSQATPLVAGCVAVIRAVFRRHRSFDPPASMVKALVINGAVDLSTLVASIPGRAPVTMPSNAQGFGRVNLNRSLLNITDTIHSGIWTLSSKTGPIRGGEKTTKITIEAPFDASHRIKLSVSMAYTDAPGQQLQNVVSVRVESVTGGQVKYGNTMNDQPDKENNVQKVVWDTILPGQYKIVVKCYDLAPGLARVACDVVWYWEEL
jgi:serine protease AprX